MGFSGEYIRAQQQRRRTAAAAADQPKKTPVAKKTDPQADPLPPTQKPASQPTGLESIAALILGIIGIALSAFFLQFGTLSPCAALKSELRAQRIRDIEKRPDKSQGYKLGVRMGVGLTQWFYDAQVNQLSTLQCASRLIALKRAGKNPFDGPQR